MRTLEVPDEVFESLQQRSRNQGISPAEWLERALASQVEQQQPEIQRERIRFPIVSAERVSSARPVTGAEVDSLFADEDLPS
jgi:hypothetical protein